METVTIHDSDQIAIVTLDNGPTNPVGPALVDDLHAALDTVEKNSRGMVLCGGEKFFSIGLDLPQLLELDREKMKAFWYRFNDVVIRLFQLPIPTACAVQGHGPGAGAILALACDYRFIADQKALMGFNEIQLDIPVPYVAGKMLHQAIGQADAQDLLYEGSLITAEQAKSCGFASAVCPKNEVRQIAVQKVKRIAQYGSVAFARTKRIKTDPLSRLFKAHHAIWHDTFIDSWFSDAAQIKLKQALKNF